MPVSPNLATELERNLAELARGLDGEQLAWASGYLAGFGAARGEGIEPSGEAYAGASITVWYGSETGNGRGVAERLASALEGQGHAVELASTADIQPRAIGKLGTLFLVMSTHGDGDPPEDAEALHKFLISERAPRLEQLSFAVFALGDSSYPDFCQTGRELDSRLAELGAKRLIDRVDVDVDFEADEDAWRERVIDVIDARDDAEAPSSPRLKLVQPPKHDRRNPFEAEVLDVAPLTVAPSASHVHHVELALEGSGLSWQPGDSLGLWPRNDPRLVDEIAEITAIDGSASVTRGGETHPASDWLSTRLELTQLTRPFIEAWADLSESGSLRALLDDRDAFERWVRTRQVADVLREAPARVDAATLIGTLRGIAPRLYSIASSPVVVDDEIHLTVARVGGLADDGRLRAGAASWQLTDGVTAGDRLPVYVESNPRFRLPDDGDRPILMIGPGTGVAPFRAFVQHRQAAGATGRNWLVFGNRNRRLDFLYQLEWQRFQRDGALTRLTAAFSRDQAEKIYVQHRLHEHGRDVYDWLEQGAHVYVCGDRRMAEDVHRTLIEIITDHGARTAEQAGEYLESLKREKRYQKDVY